MELFKNHIKWAWQDIVSSTAVVWASIVFTFIFSKHSILLHYVQREGFLLNLFLKSSSDEIHVGCYESVNDPFKGHVLLWSTVLYFNCGCMDCSCPVPLCFIFPLKPNLRMPAVYFTLCWEDHSMWSNKSLLLLFFFLMAKYNLKFFFTHCYSPIQPVNKDPGVYCLLILSLSLVFP